MARAKLNPKKSVAATTEMKFVHLYTGSDSKSHFKEVEVELKNIGKLCNRSEIMKTPGVYFWTGAPGYEHNWHNAPCRQFAISLEGEGEIVVGDGTSQRFGPGSVMLADDTTGQGHVHRVVGKRPYKILVIPLE